MLHELKKYPVKNPLLKKYIKFFWEIHADYMEVNHRVIPVRNIDLKFNLCDTPNYFCMDGGEYLLEDVYFSGLQDHYREAHLKMTGKIKMLGICFLPEGLYPFLKIPLNEFRNRLFGADEIGFAPAKKISQLLREAPGNAARLEILEKELLSLLNEKNLIPQNFQRVFHILKHNNNSQRITEFCEQQNINIRQLERLYNKYIGVSAKTYGTLNRFQNCVNQVLFGNYSKLSDIAFTNGYFDQMHFIKEFKRFAGKTPNRFVKKEDSMLHIGRFS